ncbi:hypothetical protein [Streptomyces sp. WELS2]|uniref:hypothetical protein n=1 Tax=Streptomyces sp. WELS2 TaxID=2749435 RepID=UPI0037DCE5A4
MTSTRRVATDEADGQPVSTITWCDYDPPLQAKPFEKGGGLFPEAMSDDWAAKCGPGIRRICATRPS